LKLVFAGTPDFAASHLQALIDAKHQVLAVYTQPDRPAGRGKKLQASAVKQLAQLHNIPVEQPLNFKEPDSITTLQEYECDLMVVVAYGLLLPQDVLDTPRFGCINVHGSLLPRWRGAAPIQRAIWAGDATSGVCIMQMDIGLDTGSVLLQKEIDIDNNDTSASLYSKLAALGPEALLACLDDFASLTPKIQNDAQASYAKKLSKQEARCDWSQPVEQLERNVRAFNPWPMAWFVHEEKAIKVHKAKAVQTTLQFYECSRLMSASGRHSASTQINHRPNLRADAAWASMQILEHGRSSREVMPQIFDRHTKAQDRAWLQESVFGILRVLPTLQSWLRELLNKPLKKQQKIIEHVIMVGLFQQAYMRTSSHAAVSETVNACKILKQTQLSGLVNAILRNFERENLAEKPAMQPHVQQNVPKWLYKKLALAYPEALDDICTAMLQRPPIFLRINTLKISTKAYSQLLDEHNIAHRIITPITANSASPSAILLICMRSMLSARAIHAPEKTLHV